MVPSKVDVAVVGAGLSGLSAASELQFAGLSCVVLEAMNRVGGKTLSIPASSQGGCVDLGAAWINDTSQLYMYALAKMFGFDLVIQRQKGLNVFEDAHGKYHAIPYPKEDDRFYKDLSRQAEICHRAHPDNSPHAKEHDRITFADYAKRFSPEAEYIARTISRSLLGVEPKDISALYMFNYIKCGTGLDNLLSDAKDGGQYLRNRQGNQAFSIGLAEGLPPGTVQLSSPVTKIVQHGHNSCTVETKTGLKVSCKRVIISVPSSLYNLIEFSPALPRTKKDLSNSTMLGYYAKVILVYEFPWWHEAGLSGIFSSVNGPICVTRDTCLVEDKQYSITCFIVGDIGREWSKRPLDIKHKQVVDQLHAAFSTKVKDIPRPINVILQDWSKEPWVQGAPSPVMPPGLITSDTGKALRDPAGNIHFVGTETAVIWKGYMEGAVRAGLRGAGEVIDVLMPFIGRLKSFL
ncbi:hypothetical protein EYZ11_005188 [Aspergillus tanneri]|uniref:Amine oxidase n=1 Tax=Aspergillus tanneri TaxID=1220188 RepID=A0A4S3JKZ9_9EURO|nr:hypothetical protein EYZ11_005188 [Aspergillus tanneri]